MPIRHETEDSKYILYDLDWLCSDGDSAQLSFKKSVETPERGTRELQIKCFSGIGASWITIDEMDFGVFTHQGVEWNTDFEQMALNISNFLCKKLGLEHYVWEQKDAT